MKSDLEIVRKLREAQGSFMPKFSWTDDIPMLADRINLPHDDYPLRVEKTIGLIKHYMELGAPSFHFDEQDLKSMHSELFDGEGFNERHILRGGYRENNVELKDTRTGKTLYTPPSPFHIPHLMKSIMPVTILHDKGDDFFIADSDIKMIDWYILFQTIHPFQDGNGRVGGIAIAVMSYWKYKRFLIPST